MAAICVAPRGSDGNENENAYYRPRILKSRTGWAEKAQFASAQDVRMSSTYVGGARRYLHPHSPHTANSAPLTGLTPTSHNNTTNTHSDAYKRASVLVAELLESLAFTPPAYGSAPSDYSGDEQTPAYEDDQSLARACIISDSTAPSSHQRRIRSKASNTSNTMDFSIDFGDSSGFKTKAKKKKAVAPPAKFDPWGEDSNDKKDDAGASGTGGGYGAGDGGDGGAASGAGGGGDDNNGGGNDDDGWGLSTGKKPKKKTKKQQQEEEEEERKRKAEEEAKAAAASNPDPLSWADDANDANANDDWTMSWGGAKKDKKKKIGADAPPAVPDAPPATSAFQDISLDDGAPNLDFSFDGMGKSKKNESGGGFTTWGKTWDFSSIGKEEKKEEASGPGNNNPWSSGKKNKKTAMSSGFDFGDFGTSDGNDISYAGGDDVADTKAADDAWGFPTTGKKDRKKKGGIEEIKEEATTEPEFKEEDTFSGWGAAKTTKNKKKSAFSDAFAETTAADDTTKDADMSFDWSLGGSKSKKKDLVSEVEEKPAAKADDGDDWMSGAWGAASKKKNNNNNKKGAAEDLSASIDLASNADVKTVTSDPPADDPWGSFAAKKDKKKIKKGFLDEEPPPPPEAPEPPSLNDDDLWAFGTKSSKNSKGIDLLPELEAPAEPLVAWDFELSIKDKRKKEKQMKLDGIWDDRVTQEMVDAAEAEAAAAETAGAIEPEPEPIPPPPPEPEPIVEKFPWDYGLTPVKKRRKEKEMRLDGTWDTRTTQEMIDEEKATAEAAATIAAVDVEVVPELDPVPEEKPLADEVTWDHGLDTVARRKKQKEMRADGTWEARITQTMIDEAKAAVEAAKKPVAFEDEPEFEPLPEPGPESEPMSAPAEERFPWDFGLTTKEKRKKEKEMRLNDIWDDRLTQEKIDEEAAAAAADAEAAPEPEPEIEAAPVEEWFPWDHGLSTKEKKKKEKEMRLNGTWEDRLTQEIIDEEAATATAAAAEPAQEPEPIPEPDPSIDPTPVEEKTPWDLGLTAKEKKKLEKQMKLDGTWEDRLTQEMIDEEIAATAAIPAEPEVEPEPEPVVEERFPWDYGLSVKEKKKKEKEMRLAGTWQDRLTQEKIDEEVAVAASYLEPEPEPEAEPPAEDPPAPEFAEPRLPWDHSLSIKEKKRKEKEMRLNGTWEDRLTQERINEEEAAAAEAAKAAEPESTTAEDPASENTANDGWSFGWGASKTKPKKKSLIDPEPEKTEEKAEEGWGGSWGFGLKKKTKTPVEENPPSPPFEPEPEPDSKVDDIWSFGTTSKDKKKKDKGAKKSDFFDPMVEESEAPPPPPLEDDVWTTSIKSDKKTTKKSKKAEEFSPPAPSPPALGLTPEADAEPEIPSVDDFDWGGLGTGRKSNKSLIQETSAKKSNKSLVEEAQAKKSSKSLVEEAPAKKSSVWGFGASTSATKTKREKEKEAQAKEAKEAEEQAQREEEERLQREAEEAEVERLMAEEAARSAKKSKAGKLSKTSKLDEKKKSGDLLNLLDEPVPTPGSSLPKLKKTSTRGSDKQPADVLEEEPELATDYFGSWGGTSGAKKTTGQKKAGSKKEITNTGLTNEEDALLAELNEDEIQAILDDNPGPSSSKVTKTMSNGKTKKSSSVADRIKELETKKEDAGKKSKQAEAPLINEEAELEEALTPKEAKKAARGKASAPTSAKSSKAKVKEPPSPPPIEIEPKRSKDSVPGSFPGAFADEEDDLLAIEDALQEPEPEPAPEKPKKKAAKADKKATKTTKTKKAAEIVTFDEPMDVVAEPESFADEVDLLDEEVTLPTPPPEEEKKPAKKERARVERSATASWGFWAATPTPKKSVRSKTVDDISPPSTRKTKSPSVMTRTKSSRTPRKEEVNVQKELERASKSSASDKEGSAKRTERPKPSRGMSFTNFLLAGAPPSAMRQGTVSRRQSTSSRPTSSRRQSMDQSGMMSPPPEDESPVTKKAAKLMGYAASTQRRSSVKGKSNSYADPYPIDDDDLVMIRDNDREELPKSKSKPKNKIFTNVARSSTKPRSKTLSGDEDVVMVDSPLAIDSANEDFERPSLQRSNTGRKSLFGGLFGGLSGGGSRTPVERTRSTPVTDNEDNGLPIRSRTSSRRRSRAVDAGEGLTIDAMGETDVEAGARRAERRVRRAVKEKAEEDERQAREQRRRDRREREKADLEARREKAREQARKEREAEDQRREERRARRREKEAADRTRIELEVAEGEAAAERRKEERRRLREKLEAEAAVRPLAQDDRRRTYAGEEEGRRRGKDERSKSRPKETSGRRSTALMAEYHESRSGSGRGTKPPANKTSSWIDSQKDEPPEMPFFEGTVLDESGQAPRPVEDADSVSRRRRKDKYAGMTEEEVAVYRAKRRERKLVEKSTSSDEKMAKKQSKRRSKVYEDDFYAAAEPVRTFDGRPTLGRSESKRSSFLGKFF